MTSWFQAEGQVDAFSPVIQEASSLLRKGELVAFPTETVYGLGADARNTAAVEQIFTAKGRPSDNPLIVHIAESGQLDGLVSECPEPIRKLLSAFWPGPLTVVLPVRPGAVSPRVTAGLPTVGVRMPAHPVALALLRAADCPVAAPSANRSGRPSPTRAEHVREDLGGRIAGIVDGGPTGVGLESTVVELAGGRLHVLRPGGITAAQLRETLPEIPVEAAGQPAGGEAPKAPGMKYAHYAPRGRMTLAVGSDPGQVRAAIQAQLDEARRRGERTGVLAFAEHAGWYDADCIAVCGSLDDLTTAARGLYDALRRLDEGGATWILAETCPEEGLGAAIMNRLRKAAAGRILAV
jgi:L-threonylcarbamoyladenylate synthase